MSLKPPEQFRHPRNLVVIRLNITLVKRVRTKSLELKPFLLPLVQLQKGRDGPRFSPVPTQHFIQHIPGRHIPTYEKDTHSSSRGRLLTNLLTSSQIPEDLLTADWSTGTERDPFPALSGDQQSWQQIASLGYCWSGPDLSGWPQRWRKKK